MLALLRRERTFRLLLLARTASVAGDTVLLLALPYFLYVQTGSVASSAGVFIVAALPNALLGPWLGALADRAEPRRLLIGCDLISALAAASLVWVAVGGQRWLVYAAAFVLVCCGQTVSFTRGAITPRIVGSGDLLSANSLESAAMALVRLAAPPVGGLLFVVVGLRWLVLFDAATFAVSAACVWTARLPRAVAVAASSSPAAPDRLRPRDVLHPAALTGRLIWITGAYFLLAQATVILLIPFVRIQFHGSAMSVGLLSASGAVGAVLGAVLSARAQDRFGALPALAGMLMVEGVARFTVTTMPTLPAAMGVVVITGAAATSFLTILQTTLQQSVTSSHVGRLLGLTWSIAGFATIAGMLLFTGQSGFLQPIRVLQESSLLCLALGGCALLALRPQPATA